MISLRRNECQGRRLEECSDLRQYSCKPPCSLISDLIAIKTQLRQRWALRQHSCKTPCCAANRPSTPASLFAPASPIRLKLRSRRASAGHCTSTPASLSSRLVRSNCLLRWDSRAGSRPGPRDPGLQKPWIPGTDLGQGQIPQFYSNRLKFFAVTLS